MATPLFTELLKVELRSLCVVLSLGAGSAPSKSCQGHPWRRPLPQTLPRLRWNHKTWHRPPNRCFLKTILGRQAIPPATSRQPLAIPSGGKSFAPGYLTSKHPIPFPHVFHSVSVQIELSLEAPFYINASQTWQSEAPPRLPPAPALGGPGPSSCASGSCPVAPAHAGSSLGPHIP